MLSQLFQTIIQKHAVHARSKDAVSEKTNSPLQIRSKEFMLQLILPPAKTLRKTFKTNFEVSASEERTGNYKATLYAQLFSKSVWTILADCWQFPRDIRISFHKVTLLRGHPTLPAMHTCYVLRITLVIASLWELFV